MTDRRDRVGIVAGLLVLALANGACDFRRLPPSGGLGDGGMPGVDAVTTGCVCTEPAPLAGVFQDEPVVLPRAYFGLLIDYGSHRAQANDAPLRYDLNLLFSPEAVDCNADFARDPFFRLLWLELRTGTQEVSWPNRLDEETLIEVDGALCIEAIEIPRLPTREDGWPISALSGTVSGCARLSFTVPGDWPLGKRPGEDRPVGEVSGAFVAQHCGAMDGFVME